MANILTDGNGHGGHGDWASWAKYAGAGIAVATFIVGVVNGLWGIDSKIERIVVHLEQRDKAHDALAAVVKKIDERAITPDSARDMIKMAVLELVAANPGKLASPYSPVQPKPAPVRVVPVKPVVK